MSDAWRWMPISGRPSTASMPREMWYQISTRSQLLPATRRLRRHIFISRYRRTTKAHCDLADRRGAPLKRPCADFVTLQRAALREGGVHLDRLLPPLSITAVTCVNSAGAQRPAFSNTPCHFARQPRQQVASFSCVPVDRVLGTKVPIRALLRRHGSQQTPW